MKISIYSVKKLLQKFLSSTEHQLHWVCDYDYFTADLFKDDYFIQQTYMKSRETRCSPVVSS
jgi:hypothetical protein